MKKTQNGICIIALVVIPILYCMIYTAMKLYFVDMGENFDNSVDMRVLIGLCSLLSALFILVMLILTKLFADELYSKRIIVAVIVLAHLIISYIAPEIINYYHYMEMSTSMILLIILILFERLYT